MLVLAVGLLSLALAVFVAGPRAGTALVVARPIAEPDVIISLASHEWERLPLAITLAQQHPEARLLLTLPEHVNGKNCYDCEHRVEWLTRSGIDARRIAILPVVGSNTYGEAIAARRYSDARAETVHRLLIVTSPYHTRRALAVFASVFDRSGVAIGIAPAGETSPAQPAAWWRTPYDRWYVRYEWAAIVYYAVRYGVSPRSPAPAG
jgi:uncharacterized SAM-binding protein YcdF (DUF218 family)